MSDGTKIIKEDLQPISRDSNSPREDVASSKDGLSRQSYSSDEGISLGSDDTNADELKSDDSMDEDYSPESEEVESEEEEEPEYQVKHKVADDVLDAIGKYAAYLDDDGNINCMKLTAMQVVHLLCAMFNDGIFSLHTFNEFMGLLKEGSKLFSLPKLVSEEDARAQKRRRLNKD